MGRQATCILEFDLAFASTGLFFLAEATGHGGSGCCSYVYVCLACVALGLSARTWVQVMTWLGTPDARNGLSADEATHYHALIV